MTSALSSGVDLGDLNPERVLVPGSITAAAQGSTAVTVAETNTARSIAILIAAGILAAKGKDWLKLAKGWESRGFDRAAFDREITSTFTRVVTQPLSPLLSGMLQLGRKSLVDSTDVDLVQRGSALKVADSWATKYADAVAADFGKQSALAIARVLPEWLNKRLPAFSLASRAKEVYGLDPRSAVAYENYANGKVITRNMSLRGLAERYLEQRSTITGSVHSFTALNFGRQMLYAEAIGEGVIPQSARKVWVTAIDERVCTICAPMDGVAVPVLDRFEVVIPGQHSVKVVVPPIHPRCRCTVVTDAAFKRGVITRTARFEDTGVRHLARLVSEGKDMIVRR